MKIVKKLLKLALWIIGIAAVLVLSLPLWIGPIVKTVANSVVPSKTGTGFHLGEFGLNQYFGRLTVGDMQLANPDGFRQKMAATLGLLHVDVDMGTVLSDTIVIEDVVLTDLFVSYVSNGRGENNFAVIKRNAAGDKAEANPAPGKAQADKPKAADPNAGQKPAKKVIIDHLLVKNVLVQLGPVSFPFSIELNGIGRRSSGATLQEVWDEIYAQALQKLGSLGANVNELAVVLGNLGNEQAQKVFGAARSANAKGLLDALEGGAGFVNDAAGKTSESVGDSTEKAVNTLKGLFK